MLADSARNGAVAALAREGGLESTLWAGSPRSGRPSLPGRPPCSPSAMPPARCGSAPPAGTGCGCLITSGRSTACSARLPIRGGRRNCWRCASGSGPRSKTARPARSS
ncbi:MAG TPA: hypothetical protein VG142_10150 [Trebonia sp.]|nr:hypothetical protein [Trebonia sp.]